MARKPKSKSKDEPPKYFVVRIADGKDLHYVVCETVVSFNDGNLFPVGARALEEIFREFHDGTIAEVAVLPPLNDPKWKKIGATAQLAKPGGGLGGGP